MVYCGPGDRLIDPPDHYKGVRITRDTSRSLVCDAGFAKDQCSKWKILTVSTRYQPVYIN